MPDETVTSTTRLIFDATGARQGATEFHDAAERILSDNRRVEEALARSATTLAAAQGKKAAAHKTAAGAANEGAAAEIAAAAKSSDAVGKAADRTIAAHIERGRRYREIAQRGDPFSSRLGNIPLEDIRGAQRGIARTAAAIPTENFAERTAGLANALGMHVPAGLAPARAAETEISAAAIESVVPEVLTTLAQHPGDPSLARLTRNLAVFEGNDSTIKQTLAHAHATEQREPSAGPGIVGAAAAAGVGGCDCAALIGAIGQLSLAVDRLRVQLAAEPAAARQAAAAARPLAAPAGTSAREAAAARGGAPGPWLVEPVVPKGMAAAGRDIQRQAALAERAAHGYTTAQTISFPSDALQRSLGNDIVKTLQKSDEEGSSALAAKIVSARDAAAKAPIAGLPAPTGGYDFNAWLQARKPPNEVDVEAFNRARPQPGTDLTGETGAAAGAAHQASSATDELTHRVNALAHSSREARGSLREYRETITLLASAADGTVPPLEALRFVLIGLAREYGAPAIGTAFFGGGLLAGFTLLIKRADEVAANLRSFDATIKTFGTGSAVGAEQLQQLTEEFKHTGVSAEDAKKSVDAVARSQFIRPSGYKEFLETARNASAFTGANPATTTEEFVKAFSGGTEGAIKLGESFRALSVEQINNIRDIDRHVGSLEAMGLAFDAIRRHLVPWKDELSPAGQAARDLATAWDEAVTALSQSSWVDSLREAGTWYLKWLRDAAEATNNLGQSTEKLLPQVSDRVRKLLDERDRAKILPPEGMLGPGGEYIPPSAYAPAPSLVPPKTAAQIQAETAAAFAERGTPYPVSPTALSSGGAVAANPAVAPIDFGPLDDKLRDLSGSIESDIKAQDLTRASTNELKQSTDASAAAAKALADKLGIVGSVVPGTTLAPGGALMGQGRATAPEEEILAMVKQREGGAGGPYALHYPAPGQPAQVLSLSQAEHAAVTKNSHAFGDYGFEPGTYREASRATGVNPEDISEQAQRTNALYMLRTFGPNSTRSWFESGVKLGRPYPELGAGTAELPPGAGPFQAVPGQQAELGKQTQAIKDQAAALSQYPGAAQLAVEARKKLEEEAATHPLLGPQGREQFIDQGMLLFWQKMAGELTNQHRLNDTEVADLNKTTQAFHGSIAEGYRALALGQAQRENAARGGEPGAVPIIQQDILNKQAAAALQGGQQRLALEQPAIEQQQKLAAAALQSRDAEEKQRIVAEAAAQTQDALNLALASGNKEYIAAASNIDAQAQAQTRAKTAAAEGIEAGHQIQGNRDQSQVLALQVSLQGQGSDAIRAQVELSRDRLAIQRQFPELSQQDRDAVLASDAGLIQQNLLLEEAERAAQRINEAFDSITSTISGDLTSAIRNALVRTPLEAGQHLKHYWDEFRAGLKQFAGEALSTFANLAFIKPLTGTIAGALGLGQTAQQLGTFGGLFTGGGGGQSGGQGFATGGSLVVPGGGGTDSTRVQFMATPGEKIYVLTPTQQAVADQAGSKWHPDGSMPHFAEGGTLDVGGSWSDALPSWGDPEAAGMAQASAAMQPALGSIATAVGGEARAFGQAGIDLSRAGLQTNAEFMAGKEAEGPLLGFRTDTGELTGRLPALAEQVTGGMTGPVALHEIGAGEHAAEAFEHLHQSEETIGSANTGLRFGRVASGVRSLDEAAPEGGGEQEQGENYGIDVFGTLGRGAAAILPRFAPVDTRAIGRAALPMFAGGGKYDPATGEVNYFAPDLPVSGPSDVLQSVPGASQVAQTPSGAARTYFNDAGQPFTVPNDQFNRDSGASPAGFPVPREDFGTAVNSAATSAATSAGGGITAGFFGPLVDLARKGLQSESAFLSTAAADKPLLGLDTGTGEITGRIPALADFLQQGLAGGAPAGTLSAGIKAFHGSPETALSSISANPLARQFDNATSQLGAFFAPTADEAARYAGEAGRVYETTLDLKKPYEMPWSDFTRLQSPNRGPEGEWLPGEQWASRANDLKGEATALRAQLEQAGHDGVIVRNNRGQIKEIASFGDVTLGAGAQGEGSAAVSTANSAARAAENAAAIAASPRSFTLDRVGLGHFVALGPDGQQIGHAAVAQNLETGGIDPFIQYSGVAENWRRKGVGTALYDAIESDIGRNLVPSPLGLSKEAIGLWQSRLAPLPSADRAAILDESENIGFSRQIPEDTLYGRLAPLRSGPTSFTLGAGAQGEGSAAVSTANFAARAAEEAKPPGIIAYHGSPHDFERFDISKIGTGEGAQAYGHGLYFAEGEQVARSYRDKLAPKPDVLVGGEPTPQMASAFDKTNTADMIVASRIASKYQALRSLGHQPVVGDIVDEVRGEIKTGAGFAAQRSDFPVFESLTNQQTSLARMIDRGIDIAPTGHIYEVNLGVQPDQLLHWDKPLSEQSPQVQQAVQSVAQKYPDAIPPGLGIDWGEYDTRFRKPLATLIQGSGGPLSGTVESSRRIAELFLDKGAGKGFDLEAYLGEFAPDKLPAAQQIAADYKTRTSPLGAPGSEWYHSLANAMPEQQGLSLRLAAGIPLSEVASASTALKEAGIPGIRYLDQGSRAGGEGTHNVVMFGDERIDILRKYGLAGPPPVGNSGQPYSQPPPLAQPQPTTPEPASSGFFSYDQPIPMLAEGGNVVGTGLAVVHQGESVLSTVTADNALSSLSHGLQSLSSVVGQATPGLQSLAHAATEFSGIVSALTSAQKLFSGTGAAGSGLPGLTAGGGSSDALQQGIRDSQISLNVSGLSGNNPSVFGSSAGGNTIGSGAIVSVGLNQAAAAGGEAAPAITGTAGGLSAQQVQDLLNAGTTGAGTVTQTNAAPILETFLGTITSAAADGTQQSLAAAATAAGAPTTFLIPNTQTPITGESSLAPALPVAPEAALPTGVPAASGSPAAAPATSSILTLPNAAAAASLAGSILNSGALTGFLPSWLSSSSGSGGIFSSAIGGLTGAINNLGTSLGFGSGAAAPLGGIAGAPFSATVAGPSAPEAVGGLFGTTTLSSVLGGAAAGLGAGSLLNSVLGGNQLTGTIGAGAGSLLGSLAASILAPGIGTLIGGIVGGAAGGGLGGLFGAPPSGQSAGVTIGAGGAQTFEQAGGSAANIQASNQVAAQISSFVQQLGQLTDAQGKAIGTIDSGLIAVQSNNRQGIVVTGGNIAGGQFGQNASNAVIQTELQIIQSLTGVSGTLQTVLAHITDPSQLQAAVQFVDVYDKLNVTTAQLTASLSGNVDAIGPFSQALLSVNQTFAQLTAQATQFGVSTAPLTAGLAAVTATLKQDFGINVAEALSTAIDGGNDFIASLIKIHQQYIQNINDAQALATGVPTGTTPGAAAGSASTPPGEIMVGEKGPEWMLPRGGGANDWVQVGKTGPELIDQPGGAVILPNPLTPPMAFAGGVGGVSIGGVSSIDTRRAFAQGTIGAGDVAGQVPGIGSLISQASGGPTLLEAAGGVAGLSADTISAIGSVLPAVPVVGGLLSLATGGNPLSAGIGITSGLAAAALAIPAIGVIGGLIGLAANLFGPKPSNKASGDLVDLNSGEISGFQSAGDKNADTIVAQISAGISAVAKTFQAATGGTITGAVNVQDGARDGIKTSYSGLFGNVDAKWGSVTDAIGQFALAIAHDLTGIDPTLQAQLDGINDPNALIPAIETFTGKSIDLNTATVTGPGTAPAAGAAATAATAPAVAVAGAPAATGIPNGAAAYSTDLGSFVTGGGAPVASPAPAAAAAITQDQLSAGIASGAYAYSSDAGAYVSGSGSPVPVVPAPPASGAITQDQLTAGIASGLYFYSTDAGTYVNGAGSPVALGAAAGSTSTPPGWILVGEQGPEWMLQGGGATVLPTGVKPTDVAPPQSAVSPVGRSFADGTNYYTLPGDVPAASAATTAATSTAAATTAIATAATSIASLGPNVSAAIGNAIAGTEAAQAGPVLAALGIDQLTTVIQNLANVAPEIATMAQNLISSGSALPDILTQGIQALTDPLGIAIEKEKALGQERIAVATQVGEDLVKVEQLNSANIIQAVISNLNSASGVQAIQYAGNLNALTTLQAAPVLAGLSTDQLTAVIAKIADTAPSLAALAQEFITTGTALPDTITQSLEAIVNPLKLAIQQQTAQATGRTEVQAATGQNPATVAALNTASISQAITQALGNPQALLALTANGSPQGLTALQAGPAIAGLGADQLQAVLNVIGTAAPQLSSMIQALVASGNALPDALTQASEAITQAGLLAVQKAQALGFEQIQTAGVAGQNVGEAQTLAASGVAAAVAQATNTQIPILGIPDWITQIEEAATAPLQLAIQKEQAAGAQRVEIAQATGASLVAIQKANADAIASLWYQATSQLVSLKQQITGGTLSGLTPANQVTAGIEQFNQILKLVQSGNTQFINDLASAGQAAVQAAQTAYGNGPQTASVRQQVLGAIQPFLVSASGFPTSGPTALGTTSGTISAGTITSGTTDLQNNTTALQDLTSAITTTLGSGALTAGSGSGGAPLTSAAGASAAAPPPAAAGASTQASLTTNPVTGVPFTGTGITAITPNFPLYPSASTLSNALADATAGNATAADWAAINQGLQAGILDPTKQPGYALVIEQAQQVAAGQAINPGAGLSQALSDAVNGTPTLQEWGLINQAVNDGIISPTAQPQYSTIIQRARIVANAQATSLSQIPNTQTAFNTTFYGLPAFAAGAASTPPGMIMVGERGPEWYHPANENMPWSQVGTAGPELINQLGGATILPFPKSPMEMPAFSDGTLEAPAFELPSQGSSDSVLAPGNERLFRALLMQVQAGNKQAMDDAHVANAHLKEIRQGVRPGISAPMRRAVG